jgi:hypothetical protein
LHEGVLAGRWKVADFFAMLGSLVADDQALCTDNLVYAMVKNTLCEYPDVASGQVGPTTPCDALSLGMGFEAEPARLGPVWWPPSDLAPCPPATDPANDHCGP